MKKIIHVDMDCFYAQVEMRDNPNLKNVPLAIGGLPKTRSVLCTSNYIARKFGVKSAMPTDQALKLCPNLVVLQPNFKKYQEASEIIQNIFYEYTDLVEPLSLDEAYLDVSTSVRATKIAQEIKNKIFSITGLTCSVGVAPNKFLAKIASDWNKPNGIFVIMPEHIDEFTKKLKVKLIPGVGQKSTKILEELGINTCAELRNFDAQLLSEYFGKFAYDLKNYALGIDDREVINEYDRKSLSVESTFLKDYYWSDELEIEFNSVLDELDFRITNYLKEEENKIIKKIFAKVKFNDFSKSSTEIMIKYSKTFECVEFREHFLNILKLTISKKEKPVRLIGLGVRFKSIVGPDEDEPLPLLKFMAS